MTPTCPSGTLFSNPVPVLVGLTSSLEGKSVVGVPTTAPLLLADPNCSCPALAVFIWFVDVAGAGVGVVLILGAQVWPEPEVELLRLLCMTERRIPIRGMSGIMISLTFAAEPPAAPPTGIMLSGMESLAL